MQQIEALTAAVKDLQGEASDLRDALAGQARAQDLHTRTVRRRLAALAVVVAVFAGSGLLGAWLLHQDLVETRRAADDRRVLCLVVAPMVPQAGDAPPTTRRGVEVAQGMREVARQLGC